MDGRSGENPKSLSVSLLKKANCEDPIQPAERQRLNVDGVLLQISSNHANTRYCISRQVPVGNRINQGPLIQ